MLDRLKSEKYIRLESLGMGPYAMKKLKVCPGCGQVTDARALLCPSCKSWIRTKSLFQVYKKMHTNCPHCKTMLASDAQYCPHCGRKVMQNDNKIHWK